jgi:hypothetical protein
MPLFEITAVESPYAAVEYKEKYTSFMQMTWPVLGLKAELDTT